MAKFFAEVIIENNVHCKVYEFCLEAPHYSRALALVLGYLIEKAVLCRVTGNPIAVVTLPAATRKIRVAGAYTVGGDAVNVRSLKVTADKRVLKKAVEGKAYDVPVTFDDKPRRTH